MIVRKTLFNSYIVYANQLPKTGSIRPVVRPVLELAVAQHKSNEVTTTARSKHGPDSRL